MNTYKLILTGVIFTFFNTLNAHTNPEDDFEIKAPFKKDRVVGVCCILNVGDIAYVKVEQEVDLGFNPYFYLPADFNPYKGIKLDLDDIQYIEESQEIDLGFDVNLYLPENFDPHVCVNKCDRE